ncbi:MAG: Eco57I restriction-modification methylase domain-containing protein [Candidatus Helarchaeales archaeon]
MKSSRWNHKIKGIFYTKPWIVDFMVKETIGPILSNQIRKLKSLVEKEDLNGIKKVLHDVMQIRIIDPACGDGEFLERCMEEFSNFYETFNHVLSSNHVHSISKIKYPLALAVIFNVHGVDDDFNAVRKARERLKDKLEKEIPDETKSSLVLKNIRQGHSLLPGIHGLAEDNYWHSREIEEFQDRFCKALVQGNLELLDRTCRKFNEKRDKIHSNVLSRINESLELPDGAVSPLIWQLEFPVPFLEGGFNLVIGNPPYIRVHKQDRITRSYLRKHYFTARHDFDIYVCFMELGLQLLKKKGLLSYITSDKFLSRKYGTNLRVLLLNNTMIKKIVDISRCNDSFPVATYPLIIFVEKRTDQVIISSNVEIHHDNKITIHEIFGSAEQGLKMIQKGLSSVSISSGEVEQKSFENNPNFEFITSTSPVFKMLEKTIGEFPRLISFVKKTGIFCGTPRAKDYHGWKRFVVEGKPESGTFLRFLTCRNLEPYAIKHGRIINAFRRQYEHPYFVFKPEAMTLTQWKRFETAPKIIVRGNDTRITASLDEEGSVFVGMYGIIQDVFDPHYLLGLLNSRLLNAWFFFRNPSIRIRGAFFSINSSHLLNLPVMKPTSKQESLIAKLVRELMMIRKEDAINDSRKEKELLKQVRELDQAINNAIYELYGINENEQKMVDDGLIKVPKMFPK